MRIEGWLPIAIVLGGVAASAIVATARPPLEVREAKSELPLAPVVRVTPQAIEVRVHSQGTVEPRVEIDLAAEASGRVVYVAESLVAGGLFAAGDLLVEVDPEDARVATAEAEARTERAWVEVRRSRVVLERLRALEGGSVASAAAREDAEFAVELAVAMHREAVAAQARAQRGLDQTRVMAPFDGRVRSARVDPAQYVSKGEALARVYAEGDAEVRLPISERELDLLSLPAPGSDPDDAAYPRVTFTTPSGRGDRTWTGRVLRAEAEVDRESRMIHAVARIEPPSPADGLPPSVGLFVDAEIDADRFADVYAFPRIALRDGDRVLVVGADGFVEMRDVEVAHVERDHVLVADGLHEGDLVCLSATPPAVGSQVRPLEVESS